MQNLYEGRGNFPLEAKWDGKVDVDGTGARNHVPIYPFSPLFDRVIFIYPKDKNKVASALYPTPCSPLLLLLWRKWRAEEEFWSEKLKNGYIADMGIWVWLSYLEGWF